MDSQPPTPPYTRQPTRVLASIPPQEAFKNGPRESLLYIPYIDPEKRTPDGIFTIDVDPASDTFQQVNIPLFKTSKLTETHGNFISFIYSRKRKDIGGN
jgi:hypothetical protein